MKHICTLTFSLLITAFAVAQSPMKSTAEYNGQKYPCYITEYNLPPDETETVIKEKLKSEGYNADKSKGFLVYRNVRLKDLNSEVAQDVFFKVERKSRKEKDISLVTMITAKAGQVPEEKVKGAKIVANVEPSQNSVFFLNTFQSGVNLSAYNLAVAGQVDEVAKAEKKLEGLQKEQLKIEKKIKDYEDDLLANKKDQENQANEIAKLREILKQKQDAKPLE
ncbi:MAG: hypothetical protein ABIR03_10625 [Ginsengibacter sp.]